MNSIPAQADRPPNTTAKPSRSAAAPDRRLALLIVGMAVVLTLASYARHELLWSNLYDLGIFDQAIYLLSRGLPPVSTTLGFSIWGDHAAFILYPVSWLYRLYPSVVWLFAIQGLALAMGAWPLAVLARRSGLSGAWQRGIATAYLLYPAVFNTALYDFHPEVLAVPALLWAVVWGLEGRLAPFLAALAWAAACKEVLGLTIAGLGLWLLLLGLVERLRKGDTRWPRPERAPGRNDTLELALPPPALLEGSPARLALAGALAMALGLGWFAFDSWVVIPHFSGHTLAAVNRFGYLGGPSLMGLVKGAFTHPGLVVGRLLAPDYLAYLAMLLAPIALGPSWRDAATLLPAVPMLLLNALSTVPYQRDLIHQYAVPIFPFLFVWMVLGIRRAEGRKGSLRPGAVVAMGAGGFLALAKFGYFFSIFQTHLPYRQAAFEAMRQIPPGSSILAASDLCPHLTHRVHLDEPAGGPASGAPLARALACRYILLDPMQPAVDRGSMEPAAFAAAMSRAFVVRFNHDGVVLLERRTGSKGP